MVSTLVVYSMHACLVYIRGSVCFEQSLSPMCDGTGPEHTVLEAEVNLVVGEKLLHISLCLQMTDKAELSTAGAEANTSQKRNGTSSAITSLA